jgi:hypothetical protein
MREAARLASSAGRDGGSGVLADGNSRVLKATATPLRGLFACFAGHYPTATTFPFTARAATQPLIR